jgi:serpin B
MASSITGLEHFGAKLFSTISQKNNAQNVFLSPSSIGLAISMCTVGAAHETLQQMLRVLEVSSTDQLTNIAEQMMQVFPPSHQDIPPANESTDPDGLIRPIMYIEESFKPLQLKLVNRLYAEKDYVIQQEYLDLIRKSFHSDVKLENFEHESAKAVQTINTWVEAQTNKKIRDVLSTTDVNSDTRLVLINCIYFKVNIVFISL